MSDEDIEGWRQYVKIKPQQNLLGKHVTASQWVYLARLDNKYQYVLVHIWFKRVEIIAYSKIECTSPLDLPKGEWVSLFGTVWEGYIVYKK